MAESNRKLRQFAGGGIDVESERDFVRGEGGIFHVLPDGRVIKVILHITQKALYTREDPGIADMHRYHLFNCDTLQMMRAIGREHRYKMASRGDGRFNYTLTRHDRVVREYRGDNGAELRFCGNCQRIYNRRFNWLGNRPFDLRLFIETNELHGDVRVTHRLDADDVLNVYTHDWPVIARRHKEAKNYCCEDCGINLSAPNLRRFLQAHHVDGERTSNTAMNIRVLCIQCHARQPFHEGLIPNSPAYAEFLRTKEFQSHTTP
ncbi:MAG: hypothetical protein ABMA13_04595 [Chthoniobacteraceae bacterium]